MSTMVVQTEDVISDRMLIQAALPEGFKVSREGPVYKIVGAGVECGIAEIRDGQIHFQFAEEGYPGMFGQELNQLMTARFGSSKE